MSRFHRMFIFGPKEEGGAGMDEDEFEGFMLGLADQNGGYDKSPFVQWRSAKSRKSRDFGN